MTLKEPEFDRPEQLLLYRQILAVVNWMKEQVRLSQERRKLKDKQAIVQNKAKRELW